MPPRPLPRIECHQTPSDPPEHFVPFIRGRVKGLCVLQFSGRPCSMLDMPTLISKPTRVEAAGNKPKLIDEYIGRVNSATSTTSIAHMRSPGGWQEPGQTPEFEEFTVVLRGTLRVEHRDGSIDVGAGQAVIAHKGEWVRYST